MTDPFMDTQAALADTMGESRVAPTIQLQPGTVIKHYELIRKLGAGGMGMVFLGRDIRLGRLVAIKFLLEHTGPAAERFLAEARMTAQCRHENIVVIYDVDEIEGKPYMALEYVEGRTLRDAMTGGNTSTSTAVELMVPVARALSCAHEMGIVHRDLKPENILLSDAGQVKVLDFGIAKQVTLELAKTVTNRMTVPAANLALTQEGAIVGTMPYMSPEQWLEAPIDGRTDIWAVGLMLFELCTGAHPLEPLTAAELMSVPDLDLPMPSARERLPHAPALADIIDHCLKKHKHERIDSAKALVEALERLGASNRDATILDESTSPFAGLSAFQESDAARFFGRDDDIAAVVGRLRQQQLVTIVGASGAGKSSFVRAGVIPAYKRGGRNLDVFTVRPGRRPLMALADILAFLFDTSGSAEVADPAAIAETLRTQPGYLGARLRARCRRRDAEHRALLFVDQLEELYTQGIEPAERAAFCACIEGVADDASSPLRVIMTIRADFLDRVSQDRTFLAAMTRSLFFLPMMNASSLRDALEKPLAAVGYRFEDEALLDEMLSALAGTKSPLPVMQFAAIKLWEARDKERKQLTRAAYQALGGVAGALSSHADAVLTGLSLPEQRMARTILMRLVTPERTRAVVRLDELGATSDDVSMVEQVVQLLADARLVSIDTGGERDGKTVELTHESLIDRWSKLRQWLDEDEKDAVFLTELRNAAMQWEKNDRAEGFLWRDRAAIEAGAWFERRKSGGRGGDTGIGKREFSYLEAVIELSERTKRRRRQFMGGLVTFLCVVVVVVTWLDLQATREAQRADAKAKEAQKSAELAHKRTAEARNASRMASARENLSDPTLVLALVRELEPADSLPSRWRELARWAIQQDISQVVLIHQYPVHSATMSPDGKRIVTASFDKIARVWNADGTGKPLLLEGHRDMVSSAAWSPDGKRIVTASWDKIARVWNADGTGEPLLLEGHLGTISSAAFSPDGRRIVTASADKTVRVWNADGTGKPLLLERHPETVNTAVWSPDGQRIVTTSWDKTVRVWNADGTGKPLLLEGHLDPVLYAAWSPDGQHIVTASRDKTVRVWNADGTGEPLVLQGHLDIVNSAAWSPDGQRIVTASWDKTVRVWNADGTGKPLRLEGHQDIVHVAEWSPDGRSIITASRDKTVRMWNADGTGKPLRLEGHQERISSAEWSPDGRRIITASADKTARVWNADGSGEPLVLQGHLDIVSSAAFSPNGRSIVTASQDKTARVWNADGTGTPLLLEGHLGRVSSATFSPDGRSIVTASRDKTVRVWNADGTGKPLVLEGHLDMVYSAAFSPDGRRIVSASRDKTARVWNADGTGKPLVLEGHLEVLYSAAFSADGRYIVTASKDKTARVWNADGTGKPVLLEGHTAAVASGACGQGAFSPDGQRIVTISDDQTLRVWNADGTGESMILRLPDTDAQTAAFSPDGTRIVTASHSKLDPATGKLKFWTTVWPTPEPLKSPNDAELWLATRYCPSVEVRVDLLGVSKNEAADQLAACQARVAEAFGTKM
ncbi:MAG TPA: protein kinase [Polyangium sp.]|nr:protein kinase [Polyangium sp.]